MAITLYEAATGFGRFGLWAVLGVPVFLAPRAISSVG
jgi:hypothetical protein